MKKVLAVTGIRSEYYILRPVLQELRDAGFEVGVVCSGAHLSTWHGFTLKSVIEDGFPIWDKVDSLLMTDRSTQRVKGVGLLLLGLSQTVERMSPDFLLVVGDREESIATALVGNYMKVIVAHIAGGDTSVLTDDDPIRFAVSKLAHLHFATSQPSAENLLKVGEEPFRVFNVGNPALDGIRKVPDMPWEEVRKALKWDIEPQGYIVFIKHPFSLSYEQAGEEMRMALEGVKEFARKTGFKVLGIFPNTDPGASYMIEVIKEFDDGRLIHFYPNLSQNIFVNVLRNARALVGNSSMGILESPFYKLPVVNIGERQTGRFHAGNVEFVGHQAEAIAKALQRACFDESYRERVRNLPNPFGDGYAGKRIVGILSEIDPKDRKWLAKEKLA